MMRLVFVLPRYGAQVLGGAETSAREFAERLTGRGHEVLVLTTCANDYVVWKNVEPPGATLINGVRVERFPISSDWRLRDYTDRLGRLPSASVDEQYDWVDHLPHPPALYRRLIDAGAVSELVFFVPYLNATTYYGSALVNDKAVIWPCLHNELFAHLHPTRAMLAAARGVMYNTRSEQTFAHQLGVRNPREVVVGIGIDERTGAGNRFREAQALTGPYLIYAGRLDEAKNVQTLIEQFIAYKELRGGDLKLVLTGHGSLRDSVARPDVIFTGVLDNQLLLDAIAGSLALCQPSLMESFSIVIMQAWMAGAPVLTHAGCAVTREHVTASGGGLMFSNLAEFTAAVDVFLSDADARERLARQGARYVRETFTWNAVLDRFEQAVTIWMQK